MSQTAPVSTSPSTSAPSTSRRRSSGRLRRGLASLGWALAGVLLVVLMWELVKVVGSVIPLPLDTGDQAMPHVWTMAQGALQPEVRGSDTTVPTTQAAA
ncbi:MAG: hypothetical protein ACKOE2_04840 [Actinomycetales bacterium]